MDQIYLDFTDRQDKRKIVCFLLALGMVYCKAARHLVSLLYALSLHSYRLPIRSYSLDSSRQREYIRRLVHSNDRTCIEQLRLDKTAFSKLCEMLRDVGGLTPSKHMLVDEQVAMFLYILAHHVKNRVIKHNFRRFGAIVSKCFHNVLKATLRLSHLLLKKGEPFPDNCIDDRWKHFKVRIPMEIDIQF